MKILFLNHNLIWRGTFFRCLGFARELVRQGHEVDLWTASRERDWSGRTLDIDGVKIWQTPRWGNVGGHDGGYAPVDNLVRLIGASGREWDIVHAFDHRPSVLAPWLWLKAQARLRPRDRRPLFVSDWCDWWTAGGITTERRPFAWMDSLERRIEEGSKWMSDGVTVISSLLYERAVGAGVKRDDLLLLPSGTHIESFPVLDRYDCREALELPLDGKVLGFVGYSLWDLELLAASLAEIRKEVPEAVLLLVGGGVEEQAKEIFRDRFAIGREVFLPGVVPFADVPEYLGACDVQLLPMRDTLANRARFPNKLTDYYASERPVVVSDVGEAALYVRKDQTGLVGGHDALAFARACVSLLRDEKTARECGTRARRIAETDLSFFALSRHLVEFYNKCRSR